MDRILTNGRKLLTSNNNRLLLSRERTTGQRSGLLKRSTTLLVKLNNSPIFDNLAAITFGCWVKLSDNAPSNGGIMCKWNTNNNGDNSFGLYYGQDASNWKPSLLLRTGTGNSTLHGSTVLLRGRWYHVMGAYDGANMKLYVNGVLEATAAKTGTITNTARDIILGALNSNDVYSTNCIVQAPFVLNRAVTSASEINRVMYSLLPSDFNGLLEQYPMLEGVGTTLYGTKGNNGTITGTATWTTPSLMNYVGRQLSLNGTSQYVNTALSLSGSYTKECWINPSSITGTDNILSGGNTGFQLVDGKLAGGHNGNYQQVSDTVAITGHTHVAITYNDITKLLSLYKNGLLIASATSASYTASVQQIGAFGGANLFHGKLDDVRVWNVVRTQTQIQADMNKTLGRKPGLVLNLGFESDYYDASGYGNQVTPVGSPVLEVTDNDKLLLNAPIN
jgi:hypothetical protein